MKIKGYNIFHFNKIDSTNTYAKKCAANGCEERTVILAQEQTAGKGRLGRTFVSKRGGLYFSVVLRPKNKIEDTVFITVAAAVSAARAIQYVSNKNCDIKWVNDIYINNKKICGILTEGGLDKEGKLAYAVLGVGVNLFEPEEAFPKNIPLADSVFHKKDRKIFKNRVKRQFLTKFLNEFFLYYQNLDKKEYIKEYQQKSFLTAKQIIYIKNGKEYTATVEGIDNEARLIVICDGKRITLSHGEIQIIGMEQLPV